MTTASPPAARQPPRIPPNAYLIDAYRNLGMGDKFFTSFFEKLMGVGYVRRMIGQGKSADEIETTWQDDVARFKEQRKPYLLYDE